MEPKPARGTRPPNRRAGILTAAAQLFCARGYEHVSMSDIAGEVAIGPSALYRHFPSKQDLLREVIRDRMAVVTQSIEQLDLTATAALTALADFSIAHAELGTLWLRESRHLPLDAFDEIKSNVQNVASQLKQQCAVVRPDLDNSGTDLVACSILGVLLSPSFQRIEVPATVHANVLVDMMDRILEVTVPGEFASNYAGAAVGTLLPHSRREALLLIATRLFAERRYASVGIEDVAAALDIAGPSIYNYFASKSELLSLVLGRASGLLYLGVADVFSSADSPLAALHGLIRSYVSFATKYPDLVSILITEVRNLTLDERQNAIAAQRDYVNEWTQLLDDVADTPGQPETASIRAQTALTVINTVSQVYHLRTAAHARPAIAGIVAHSLGLPAPAIG
ncbi:TetR/AcrR family transcriptional regulator [Mycolicibacterium fortuitum]|uniref:TetR/AcrR family transcriptional regulator n=1 Tax=Mycolicibacterium fortuitum TaxID=1766 RepID=UPI0023505762